MPKWILRIMIFFRNFRILPWDVAVYCIFSRFEKFSCPGIENFFCPRVFDYQKLGAELAPRKQDFKFLGKDNFGPRTRVYLGAPLECTE